MAARPRVWWHWMNGNISKEGIKLDLEWMHRIGLGGFQTFDTNWATPQVVRDRLVYMTTDWKDAFKYATILGEQLGLEEAISSSPGFSETGGPWVSPEEGMKKYVWSETLVEGGKPFTGILAHPPSNTGAFQNIGIRDWDVFGPASRIPGFYADAAVVAYRRSAEERPDATQQCKVTASAGELVSTILNDGDLEKATKLPIPPGGETAWIQYEFPQPQNIRSLTIVMKNLAANPEKTLEISDDGRDYREVVKLPDGGAPEHTISFPPVTGKFFRVSFRRAPAPPLPAWARSLGFDEMEPADLGKVSPPPADYEIAELVLRPAARVNRFEEKAAFVPFHDLYKLATPSFATTDAISKSDIIDLTKNLRRDGTLDWTPPPGDWVVLRFGYSLLGITNHPATAEATGLEVDKLNGRYVQKYLRHYLDSYQEAVGSDHMGKRGIRYVVTDSSETGAQNWTDDMISQFEQRRGYSPIPWLPVLAGRIVENAEASDRFLWDFRKTVGDLIADEHYGQIDDTLKERGLGRYGEAHEFERAFVADGMEVKKRAAIPMGAMWVSHLGVPVENFNYDADDRESASVAHIYGQNIAAAESLTAATGAWAWSPATLKPAADQELLNGINRFVIHESAHQPLVDKVPGLTLGPYGQWFNRNDTWAELAGPWVSYLARCSYLLQQGQFVADLVYFYGEDSNLTALYGDHAPDIPAGHGFDYINADGLIHELRVSHGCITTASGMCYRVLGLDPFSQHMSLPVLRAIRNLVEHGATVAGPKPFDDPSLADDQQEFHRIADELFGDGTGLHQVGKGTVYAGKNLAAVFADLKIGPDFDYTKPSNDTRMLFVHRALVDGDLYFLANRTARDEWVQASFRVTGKVPELWHAENGKAEQVSFRTADGRTTVPLHLESWGSVFIVFRQITSETSITRPTVVETPLETVDGAWHLGFQPGRGAPSSIILDKLSSWTENLDTGVKYFSGTGTYTKTIYAPTQWFKSDARLIIDLGEVKNLAEVLINGKSVGIVWHTPFRFDVTRVLHAGANRVEIRVTNSWVNRLIGDQQPDVMTYTFTTGNPYKATSPLLPSGVLGPVTIISSTP
ncbi:MAG TPA: glycosyl hydrolase [Candidatus Limnocylindria bacterium]|nr:glycosyl hydrolase [Candidatus Limnocylindria bacterium]